MIGCATGVQGISGPKKYLSAFFISVLILHYSSFVFVQRARISGITQQNLVSGENNDLQDFYCFTTNAKDTRIYELKLMVFIKSQRKHIRSIYIYNDNNDNNNNNNREILTFSTKCSIS